MKLQLSRVAKLHPVEASLLGYCLFQQRQIVAVDPESCENKKRFPLPWNPRTGIVKVKQTQDQAPRVLPVTAEGAVVEVAAGLLERDEVGEEGVVGLLVVGRPHALELRLQLGDLLAHVGFLQA